MYRTKCKSGDFKCKWYLFRGYPEKKTTKEQAMDRLVSDRSFLFRKISPELTAANPPLFAEEDWP